MKKIVLILTLTLLTMTAIPVLAEEVLPPDPNMTGRLTADHDGEFIIFDVFVLRPLGLVSMAVGAASSVVAAPVASLSNSQDRVDRELIQKPYWYTVCRPVGDIDF